MSKDVRIFLDSDVIVASLLSSTGAAFELVNAPLPIERYVSNISTEEIHRVIGRLNISTDSLEKVLMSCQHVQLALTIEGNIYNSLVTDPTDAHIVAGASLGRCQFLITYNLKHFKLEEIKQKLNIIVYRPAQLLQYLRSS